MDASNELTRRCALCINPGRGTFKDYPDEASARKAVAESMAAVGSTGARLRQSSAEIVMNVIGQAAHIQRRVKFNC